MAKDLDPEVITFLNLENRNVLFSAPPTALTSPASDRTSTDQLCPNFVQKLESAQPWSFIPSTILSWVPTMETRVLEGRLGPFLSGTGTHSSGELIPELVTQRVFQ